LTLFVFFIIFKDVIYISEAQNNDDIQCDKLLYNDDTLNNNINEDYMKYLKYKIKYLE